MTRLFLLISFVFSSIISFSAIGDSCSNPIRLDAGYQGVYASSSGTWLYYQNNTSDTVLISLNNISTNTQYEIYNHCGDSTPIGVLSDQRDSQKRKLLPNDFFLTKMIRPEPYYPGTCYFDLKIFKGKEKKSKAIDCSTATSVTNNFYYDLHDSNLYFKYKNNEDTSVIFQGYSGEPFFLMNECGIYHMYDVINIPAKGEIYIYLPNDSVTDGFPISQFSFNTRIGFINSFEGGNNCDSAITIKADVLQQTYIDKRKWYQYENNSLDTIEISFADYDPHWTRENLMWFSFDCNDQGSSPGKVVLLPGERIFIIINAFFIYEWKLVSKKATGSDHCYLAKPMFDPGQYMHVDAGWYYYENQSDDDVTLRLESCNARNLQFWSDCVTAEKEWWHSDDYHNSYYTNNRTLFMQYSLSPGDGVYIKLEAGSWCYSLGVKNYNWSQVNIYPNPFSDVIHVSSFNRIKEIEIKDINGNSVIDIYTEDIIYTNVLPGSTGDKYQMELDTQDLVPGEYFITVFLQIGRRSMKLIKQ